MEMSPLETVLAAVMPIILFGGVGLPALLFSLAEDTISIED